MRPIVFALPLLAATAIFAQSQTTSPSANAAYPRSVQVEVAPGPFTLSGACPVGMSARQQGGAQTVWTIALEDGGKSPGQLVGPPRDRRVPLHSAAIGPAGTGVHVDLKAWKGGPIRQVELSVDYLAPGYRVMPVGVKPGDDLKKTYELGAPDGASLKLAGDLLVGRTAGVTRVTLLGVEYANGTSWHASKNDACSVAPNGFKLVGAR